MWRGKKGAIFDMDGTLVDSMWMWKDIDIAYLRRFGFELPEGLQDDIEGMSMPETAVYFQRRFGIMDSIEKIQDDWNEMAMEIYERRVSLKKDARILLEKMKRCGMKIGIATSNSPELAMAALTANCVDGMFDIIRTAGEVPKGKPAPDIYLSVANQWGIDPEDCIVFEDVPAGVMAAKAAGMEVCAVYDEASARKKEEILARADYYILSFSEILG